ncbi:acetyl esterase [Streptomyces sp. DvalAA-14]|uniref:alpha/beta hydrolase n=1 Tax=unclassified Streptomyces TaxID=2593676 RepID=UPI00081B27CA|nr:MULTISPECIES: alpha/beta hydrolase [unclassified Streptomyces]MYS21815.1 alpha/beta hydrolase fold domain-containing protein [Streptomyces sp. SID4948]SCE01728.1 acetyl esterase [Streptomyces sp. DvalAA-14]
MPAPGEAVTVTELVYRTVPGADLPATLYTPRADGPFPAAVYVHGGTWVGGSRFSNEATVRELAANGVTVLAIDFRMPPTARYPAPVSDVGSAISWLKRHADQAKTAPGLVGGLGFSSGGHQLMLAAMRPRDPRYRDPDPADFDASLAFAALCYAVLDPLERYRMARREAKSALLAGHAAYWPSEGDMDEGSPQRILERGESAVLPPILAIQGRDDQNLTPDMADRFVAAYRRRGGSAELAVYDSAPHGFLRKHPDSAAAGDAGRRMTRFLQGFGDAQ